MKKLVHLQEKRRAAFTLIELLVVMAIIAILAAVTAPMLGGVMMGSNITRAGETISDNLKAAHMYAISQNKDVEVRFFSYAGTGTSTATGYRAIQLLEPNVDDSGTAHYKSLTKVIPLPPGTIMIAIVGGTDFSNLFSRPSANNVTTTIPAMGNMPCTYTSFLFQPNGGTDLPFDIATYYVTVAKDVPMVDPPKNFYTVQIDPTNSKISELRP